MIIVVRDIYIKYFGNFEEEVVFFIWVNQESLVEEEILVLKERQDLNLWGKFFFLLKEFL